MPFMTKTMNRALRCQIGNEQFAPDVQDAWVEVAIPEPGIPKATRWMCAVRFVKDKQHGRPVIGELRIFPNEIDLAHPYTPGRWKADRLGFEAVAPRGGITARLLREFRLGDRAKFLATIQRTIAREIDRDRSEGVVSPVNATPLSLWLARSLEAATTQPPRARQGKLTDVELAQLARQYADLIERGEKRPNKVLQQRLGLASTTITMRVWQARQKGFLTTPSGPGVPGGRVTPKARAFLESAGGAATGRGKGRPGRCR
jgi:hypothetical protein